MRLSFVKWNNTGPLSPDILCVSSQLTDYMSLSPNRLNVPYPLTDYISLVLCHTVCLFSGDRLPVNISWYIASFLSPDILHVPTSWLTICSLSPDRFHAQYVLSDYISQQVACSLSLDRMQVSSPDRLHASYPWHTACFLPLTDLMPHIS